MKIISLAATILLFATLLGAQENWELVKDKEDIKVYTYKPEGKKLEEVKIIAKFNSSISSIVNNLEDFSVHTKWMYGVKSSELLDSDDSSADHFYQYQVINMPFPTKDRDIIVEYNKRSENNGDLVIIDSKVNTSLKEESDDYVRITDFKSSYILTKVDANNTHVEYYLSADPGGKLANWIINMFTTKGPYESMKKLKELSEKS